MPQMTANFFGSDGANCIAFGFSDSNADIEATLIPHAVRIASASFEKISSREWLRAALHACRPELLPGLTRLHLSNQNRLLNFHKLPDNMTHSHLALLCTWINPLSRLSQLRELRLAYSVIHFSETKQSSSVLASLFGAVFLNLPQLQLLDVTGIPFGNDGITILSATLSQLQQLRSFVCGDVRLKVGDSNQSRPRPVVKSQSDASALSVLASMLPPSLQTLDIQSNELHLLHSNHVAPLMFHCNLTSINVSNCCMNDSDLILLFSSLPNAIACLQTFSCSRNKDVVFKLPQLLELFGSLSSLTSLSLAYSGIDNAAAIMLSRCFMKLTRLQEVDVSHLTLADHVAACNLAGALMTLPQCVRFTANPHSSMISTFVISRRGAAFAVDNDNVPSSHKQKRRPATTAASGGGDASPLNNGSSLSFACLSLKSPPSTPDCVEPLQLPCCSLDELAVELQCVCVRIRHLGALLRNDSAEPSDVVPLVVRQLALYNDGGRLLTELALLVKCRRLDLNSNSVPASPGTPLPSSSRRLTPELTEPALQLRLLEQAKLHLDKAGAGAAASERVVVNDLLQLQLQHQLWCSNFEGVKAMAQVMERKVFWWMYGLRQLPCQQVMGPWLLENKRSPLSVLPDIIQDGLKSNLMALKWIYSTQPASLCSAPSRIAIFVEGPSDVQFLDALMSSQDSLKLLRRCECDDETEGETVVLKYASSRAELRFFETKLQCAADLKHFAFQWGNFFGVGADDVASVLLPAGCRVIFMHDGDVLPDIGLLSDDNGSILHRHWRWGRAIENYLVPADWLLHNTPMAQSLLCELLVTITKRFFVKSDLSVWNNPCAATALVSVENVINSIPADDFPFCSVSVRERPDACVKIVESHPHSPARSQAASWLLSLQDALLHELFKADGCGSSLSKLLFPCSGCDACPGMIVRLLDIGKGYSTREAYTCLLCGCACSSHVIPSLESPGADCDVLRRALANLLAGCNSHNLMTCVTGKPTHATCSGHTAKLSADDIDARRDAHGEALRRTLAEGEHARCKELLEVRAWLQSMLM